MKRLLELVLNYPKITILLVIHLTLFLGFQIKHLRFETDAESMIPHDHPAFIYNEQVKELFGVRDPLIVGIFNDNHDEDGVFNPRTLALIKRLSERILEIDGVVTIRNEDIPSLATMDSIMGTDFGMEVIPFMEDVPTTAEEVKALKEAVYHNDMYVGWLVSPDGKAASIMMKMEESEGTKSGVKKRADVYFGVKKLIDEEIKQGAPEKMYIAGRGAVEVTYGIYSSQDMARFMPLVTLVILAVLFLTYRSLRGVILPFMVVVFSVIWALGIMGLTRTPMFFISTMMPVILMACGVAYGIHILGRYYEEVREHPQQDRKETVRATMLEMWPPVVMTALTTAAGFFSLYTAYMVPIRYFGLFTGIGILAAMIFSLTLMPAGLVLLKPKKSRIFFQDKAVEREGIVHQLLTLAGGVINRRGRLILNLGMIIILFSFIGLLRVYADSTWIGSFNPKSEVRIADSIIKEKFQGTLPLNVIIEGKEEGALKDPRLLKKIDGLQQYVETMPQVGGSLSIAEYVKRMNRVLNEDRQEMEVIPDSRKLIAQYLLLYSFSGDPDDFDEIVNYDYRRANVWFYLKSDHTTEIVKVVERIQEYIDRNFSPEDGVRVNLSGLGYLSQVWVGLLLKGQISSLLVSIIAVFFITTLIFRSPTAGLFNIVPISVATLFNFGLLGVLGIPLEVSIALCSSIIIGIGIDYTIHFMAKYRLKVKQGYTKEEATLSTMVTSGEAIFFNAIVVIAGFLVFLTSSFPPNAKLGKLVALNMLASFLGAMTILPALLNRIQPKFVFSKTAANEPKQKRKEN